MSITIIEAASSGRSQIGEGSDCDILFHIRGTSSRVEAISALMAWVAPTRVDGDGTGTVLLAPKNYAVEPKGPDVWLGTVRYAWQANLTGESVFSFDTAGGTQHISHSANRSVDPTGIAGYRLYPQDSRAPGMSNLDPCPDHGGAINIQADGQVAGLDIPIPAGAFAVKAFIADTDMTSAYTRTLHELTGCVNETPFYGHEAGEIRFKGATGNKRGRGDWEVTYQFEFQPNQLYDPNDPDKPGITVGDIEGIEKYGWDYLEVYWEDETEEDDQGIETGRVKVVKGVCVHPYPRWADLNDLNVPEAT